MTAMNEDEPEVAHCDMTIDQLRHELALESHARDIHLRMINATLIEVDQLRRDLATRDRELAEAREGETRAIRLYETAETNHAKDVRLGIDAAVETVSRGYQRDLDQARAALARLQIESDKAVSVLIDQRNSAQEEAKGLRAFVAWEAANHCTFVEGVGLYCFPSEPCRHRKARDLLAALAARQQQPDGKKEDGRNE